MNNIVWQIRHESGNSITPQSDLLVSSILRISELRACEDFCDPQTAGDAICSCTRQIRTDRMVSRRMILCKSAEPGK